MQPVLSLDNVSKYYTSASNVVMGLNSVRLSFRRGEFVAITGESGSGKSTLSNIIGGIIGYESGEMLLQGRPTSHYDSSDWERYRRDNISYISQDYGILPGATVLTNVVTALRLCGVEKAAAKERAKQLLEDMELWHLRRRRASKLSSGQKQRLSIARALAKPAPVLIADEPTGNLDPENSAKVISLLAQAAKSRLVIIVTHEFDEVKDHATRHIRLQDGSVVMDAPLRPAVTPEPLPQVETKANPKMGLFVSALQLRSRPVWSALMAVLFTLTAFAVVAFMGTFIIAQDDTSTKLYDPSAFVNGSPQRIIVSTSNLQPMTQADYEALANLRYVLQVERNGYVSDAQYAYRKGVDYTERRHETIHQVGSGTNVDYIHEIKITYEVHTDAPFLQTVPVLPQGQTFLKEGRLPESFYEVIAHTSDGFQVGDKVQVFLRNQRYWHKTAYLVYEFEVVGLTDVGSGLYFSDDMGRFCQQIAHTYGNAQYYVFLPEKLPVEFDWGGIPLEYRPADFTVELKDDECQAHSNILSVNDHKGDEFDSIPIAVPNINLRNEGLDPLLLANRVTLRSPRLFIVQYKHPMNGESLTKGIRSHDGHNMDYFTNLMLVSQSTFDQLTWNSDSEQVSLTIADYAYTDRVLEEIKELGYIASSPYRLGSVKVDEDKAAQREQTLKVCLLALLAVVLLQIVVLRVLFGAQLSSYKLLRNIGLVRKGAKASVWWQFAFFAVIGQLLTAVALFACYCGGVERVREVLIYLPAAQLAALSVLHLAVSAVAGFWTVHALQKQIYPVAGRFVDLQMDEEVSA